MLFGYADPPYIGMAGKYKEKKEVDHFQLLRYLRDYFDCWALRTHEPGLFILESFCRKLDLEYRVGIWVKPFHSYKPGVNPSYGWEALLFGGGRKFTRQEKTVPNFVSCNITLRAGLVGAKPEKVNEWVLSLLHMQTGDRLLDLYPGTRSMEKPARDRGIVYITR